MTVPTRLCARPWTLAVLVLALLSGEVSSAAAQSHGEYDVKAAVLFRIARVFVWPDSAFASPSEPIRIGVLGEDPFEGRLAKTFEGRSTPEGRPFEVFTVHTLKQATVCEVLYVPRDAEATFDAWRADLDRRAILLVGEEDDFVQDRGGILSLILDGAHTRMVLNVAELDESGLQTSSQFLRLCTIVGDRKTR